MIRDLEVLLLSVLDADSREYMQESVACYNAAAYRAAVVLSVAAGMDGLRRKLAQIVAERGAPPAAVTGHQEIEKKFNAQDAFEFDLIRVSEQATLISPAEAKKLRVVLATRHLCAHPSGHVGTAEEARDAITAMIDIILSKPALVGLAGVATLVERLGSPNFFPKSVDEGNVRATVRAEVRHLHPALHNALAPRLVDSLLSHSSEHAERKRTQGKKEKSTEAHRNIRRFLMGLIAADDNARRAVWRQMGRIIEAPDALKEALWLLSRDPTGLTLADPLVRERALSIVRRNLDEGFARRAAKQWIAQGVLSDDERDELLEAATRALIEEAGVEEIPVEEVLSFSWPALEERLFARLVEGAGEFDWDTANTSIERIQALSQEVAARISDLLRVRYILNVARRAQGPHAAFAARGVRDHGLGARSDFVDALISAAHGPATLLAERTDWEQVARIVQASGRDDALPPLIAVFEAPSEEAQWGLPLLNLLAKHPDETLAAQAVNVREKLRKTWDWDVWDGKPAD